MKLSSLGLHPRGEAMPVAGPHGGTGRILGFDGLRGVAALMVVANHKTDLPTAFNLYTGSFGVTLFFVLSGFLIVRILFETHAEIRRGDATFKRALAEFYENRLFRIWPPYAAVIAVAFALGAIGFWPPLTTSELVGAVTFTFNLFQAYTWTAYPEHIGALWSVAVEEQFYLLAAPLFLLAPRRMFPALCLLVIAVAGLSIPAHWLLGLPMRANYVGSLSNFGIIALGGYVAIAATPSVRFARMAPAALAAFALLPIASAFFSANGLVSLVLRGAAVPLVALVLVGIVSDQSSALVRALCHPVLTFLGRISYGLYLYHGLIDIRALDQVVGSPSLVRAFEAFLAVALAAVSWSVMEQPLLRLKERLRRNRAAASRVRGNSGLSNPLPSRSHAGLTGIVESR